MDILEYFIKELDIIKRAPVLILLIICVTGIASYWLANLRLKVINDRLAYAQDQIADRDKLLQDLKESKISRQKDFTPSLHDIHRSLVNFAYNPELIQISIPGKTGYFPKYKHHLEFNLGWEWRDVIKSLSELLNSNILYYRFGDKYQFMELSSGEIINIPTDIPKGLMPKDTGIREGMIFELREKTT